MVDASVPGREQAEGRPLLTAYQVIRSLGGYAADVLPYKAVAALWCLHRRPGLVSSVDSCRVIAACLEILGIPTEPVPVLVKVIWRDNVRKPESYGRVRPGSGDSRSAFDRYTVLFVPAARRLVDPTAAYLPALEGTNREGLLVQTPVPDLWDRHPIGVDRGDVVIAYTQLPRHPGTWADAAGCEAPGGARCRHAGARLAAQVVDVLRWNNAASRIDSRTYPVLASIVDVVGEAPLIATRGGGCMFRMPDGGERRVADLAAERPRDGLPADC